MTNDIYKMVYIYEIYEIDIHFYVCIKFYIYTCIHTHVYLFVYVHMYVYVCRKLMSMRVGIHHIPRMEVCMCARNCLHIHTNAYVCRKLMGM